MEETKQKNKTWLIIILVLIILGLASYIVYDKVLSKEENGANEQTNNNTTYKAFKKGEEITLSDASKWLVIKDSDEFTEYVTVLSEKDFLDYFSSTDELDGAKKPKVTYNMGPNEDNLAKINEYFNSIVTSIPAELKEVDGYKIRLIQLDEILNYDNNWEYDSDYDAYDYKGDKPNEILIGILTMTPSNCDVPEGKKGKCAPYYSTGCSYSIVNSEPTSCFISHWQLGLGGLKPVINIYKSSIK